MYRFKARYYDGYTDDIISKKIDVEDKGTEREIFLTAMAEAYDRMKDSELFIDIELISGDIISKKYPEYAHYME